MGSDHSPEKTVSDRIVRIKLVDGTLINGQVNINRDPGYDRLSDLISDRITPFLIIFNAMLYDASLEQPVRRQTMFVNKTHILWVEPDEDQK